MAERFRFEDIAAKEPLPGFLVRRHAGAGAALQEVRLKAGEGSSFSHAHETEQYILMLEGRMRLAAGGETLTLAAGDVLHLAPMTPHGDIRAETDCRFIDIFNEIPPPL